MKAILIYFLFFACLHAKAQTEPDFSVTIGGIFADYDMNISANGKILALNSNTGALKVIETVTRQTLLTDSSQLGIKLTKLSPDGNWLIYVDGMDSIIVYNLVSRKIHTSFKPPISLKTPYIFTILHSLVFISDNIVLFSTENGDILKYDIARNKGLEVLNTPDDLTGISFINYAKAIKEIVCFSKKQGYFTISPATGAVTKKLSIKTERRKENPCSVSHAGKSLAMASKDSMVECWNLTTGASTLKFNYFENSEIKPGHNIRSICYSSDDKYLLCAFSDRTVRLFDATTGMPLNVYKFKGDRIDQAIFSFNDDQIIFRQDNQVKFFKKGKITVDPYAGTRQQAAEINAEGKAQNNSRAGVFIKHDPVAATGEPRLTMPYGHQSGIARILFTKSNELMITSDQENTIVWDVRSGKPLHYLEGHSAAINASQRYLATANKNTVLIWDLLTGHKKYTLSNAADAIVVKISFNPVTDHVLTLAAHLYEDGINYAGPFSIALWDLATEQYRADFNPAKTPESRGISDAAFDRTGAFILVGYTSTLWKYPVDKPASNTMIYLGSDPEGKTKILDNELILHAGTKDEYYDITGKLLRSTAASGGFLYTTGSQKKYVGVLDGTKARIIDLESGSEKILATPGIRNIYFNAAGSHMLVEKPGSPCQVYNCKTLHPESTPDEKLKEGFPEYLLVTKTDSAYSNSGTEQFKNQIQPELNKIKIPAIMGGLSNEIQKTMAGMFNDAKSSYSNFGYIINTKTDRRVSSIQSEMRDPGDVRITDNKTRMFYRTEEKLYLYSIAEAKLIAIYPAKFAKVYFTPDSKRLILFQPMALKTVIIDANTGHTLRTINDYSIMQENTVLFSADSKYMFLFQAHVAGNYFKVDLTTGTVVEKKEGVVNFSISPDNTRISYSYKDGSVRIVNASNAKELLSISNLLPKGNVTWSTRVIFGANQSMAILWNESAAIYIPDISSPGNKEPVNAPEKKRYEHALLSANNKYLYLQTDDNLAQVYSLDKKVFTINTGIPLASHHSETDQKGSLIKAAANQNLPLTATFFKVPLLADFSITGDSLLICAENKVIIYRCNDGKQVASFPVEGMFKTFSFKNDQIITFQHGLIIYYRISTGKKWFSLVPFSDGRTVFVLPDGKYYGPKDAIKQIGYVANTRSLSFKQFDLNNNRPDLVLKELGNKDECLLALYSQSHLFRMQRADPDNVAVKKKSEPPAVNILNERRIPDEVSTNQLQLQYRFTSPESNLDRFSIWVNGVPLYNKNGIHFRGKTRNVDTTISITLSQGKNFIETTVFNSDNVESYRLPFYINYAPPTPRPGNIYFIGIGCGEYKQDSGTGKRNLPLAAKDIRDVAQLLKSYFPNSLFIDTLINQQVNTESMAGLKKQLLTTHVDDIVIIYYAGHGVIDEKKWEAFFGTYEMDFGSPSAKGISFRDFESLVDGIPARNRAIFIDACHSGELNKQTGQTISACRKKNTPVSFTAVNELDALAKDRGNSAKDALTGDEDPFRLMLELYADINPGDGSYVIAAAEGFDNAQEDARLNNGVFTYHLLNGIKNKMADLNQDNNITIDELKNYVIEAVKSTSRKEQNPITRKENNDSDWIFIHHSN